MVYACRICEYEEDVPNKCVYKNDLLTVAKCVPFTWLERAWWLTRAAAGSRSASPRTSRRTRRSCVLTVLFASERADQARQGHDMRSCPSCGNYEYVPPSLLTLLYAWRRLPSAVFFQDQSKRKETRMILFYVCTSCGHNYTDAAVTA
jgi:DNA-directed RNA polymerase II subunit RPB9